MGFHYQPRLGIHLSASGGMDYPEQGQLIFGVPLVDSSFGVTGMQAIVYATSFHVYTTCKDIFRLLPVKKNPGTHPNTGSSRIPSGTA